MINVIKNKAPEAPNAQTNTSSEKADDAVAAERQRVTDIMAEVKTDCGRRVATECIAKGTEVNLAKSQVISAETLAVMERDQRRKDEAMSDVENTHIDGAPTTEAASGGQGKTQADTLAKMINARLQNKPVAYASGYGSTPVIIPTEGLKENN